MPTKLLTSVLALVLLPACSVIGELAYDSKVERDKESCNKALDNSAYRACLDRVRAIEAQANSARKAKD